MDEDSVALVKDRLMISEVVEVLRDPSMITDPPQRPKAVPNLHISYLLLFQETNLRIHPVVRFSCSANFHFITQIILFS